MMQVLVRELVLRLNYSKRDLIRAAAARLGAQAQELRLVRLVRRSIDARPIRPHPCYVINAIFFSTRALTLEGIKNVELAGEPIPEPQPVCAAAPQPRPVVVGAGPAGLLAAYHLARSGARPLLIDRGLEIPSRRAKVGAFWGRGELDPECNVLYGEGGAGAFSDGKLTSRTKDLAGKEYVLRALVECGAPESILYDAQAHLGSDVLARLIPRMRERIMELGGEVRYGARLTGLVRENGVLRGVRVNDDEVACGACVLATGHSAGDVYRLLAVSGVALEGKGYALGVRVELPQTVVDRAQWGRFAGRQGLGAASFFLTSAGRCHSFCMCPGGSVIACAQAGGLLTTNGMSLSTRSGAFANAAFLVPQPAGELAPLPAFEMAGYPQAAGGDAQGGASDAMLADLLRLEEIERRVFWAGGGDYSLPACSLAAFLGGGSPVLPQERSCRRARAADLRLLLPEGVSQDLAECILPMLRKLGRIAPEAVTLYGAETRSTSALRVVRDEAGQSVSLRGLYPAGEGAGYAGGIVSSAIDGYRCARHLLAQLAADGSMLQG